jgi:peptide/nickel transport system permease protein
MTARLLAAAGMLAAAALVVFGLGPSSSESAPVWRAILEGLPGSIELLAAAFIATVAIGGTVGFARARARVPVARGALTAAVLTCRAIPLVIAVRIVLLAVIFIPYFPSVGIASSDAFDLGDRLRHLVAPVLVLAVPCGAWASVIFYEHFRRTAERTWSRGIAAPVAATAAMLGPVLASGALLVEPRFAWRGVGRVFVFAVQQFDFAAVAGCLVVYVAAVFAVIALTGPAGCDAPAVRGRDRSLSPLGVAGCAILLLTVLAAVAAPLLAPVGPYFIDQAHWSGYPLAPGTGGHVLGTDENGRDLLARLLFGLRNSLGITAGATLIATALAALAAKALASVRWIGTESALAVTAIRPFAGFPLILTAVLVLVASTRSRDVPSPLVVALMIGGVSWPAGIPAFRVSGARRLAGITSLAAGAFLLEVTVSSTGFGVQPPAPSVGTMLVNAFEIMNVAPWIPLVSSITIVVVLAALYPLADGLREIEPREIEPHDTGSRVVTGA